MLPLIFLTSVRVNCLIRKVFMQLENVEARENEGTERDIEGVGWDTCMSIPLKFFLVLGKNGSPFPQTFT